MEAINRLIQEDDDLPGLSSLRQKLGAANIFLGSTVLEDLQRTKHVRAFVGIRLSGPFPANLEFMERAIQDSPFRERLFSLYRCRGSYALLAEVICDDLQELDALTEWRQNPPGAFPGLWPETTTFVVASVEGIATLPTRRLPARDGSPILDALARQGPDWVHAFRDPTLPSAGGMILAGNPLADGSLPAKARGPCRRRAG